MLTPWGEALDKNAVLQEYPRPQLVRESYYNLNGLWDYAITASDACPGAWSTNGRNQLMNAGSAAVRGGPNSEARSGALVPADAAVRKAGRRADAAAHRCR